MYTFNDNYFNIIDSSLKAYLLGFICADGNIYKREGHQGQLGISVRDYDTQILQLFKEELNSNHPIHSQQDKRRPNTIMNSIVFVSDILYSTLNNYGITDKKTFKINYDIIFNKINIFFISDFLLGYFDGDGNIDCPKNGTISRAHVRYSGPINQLKQFQKVFDKNSITFSLIEDKRKYNEPFGSLECIGTINKYCALKFLYQHNLPSLLRKKELALELIRRIENNVTNRSENKKAVLRWEEIR